jgi:hypothetical protein
MVSDMAVATFAQAGDPTAPPPALPTHPAAGAQAIGLALATAPAPPPLADRALSDSVVLDSDVTLALSPPAPAIPVAAVLVEGTQSEAAVIVQSANVLADVAVQPDPVTPPAALTGLVDHGQHLAVGPPAARPGVTALSSAAPATDAAPAPTSGAGSTSPTPLSAIDPHVTAMVLKFAGEVSVLDVAVSGHEIILYDGAIFQHLSPGTVLESMTFNFTDGSSISLVGTAAELNALHLT